MINAEHGMIEVKGCTSEVLADLTCVISGLYRTLSEKYSRVEAVMMIIKTVELGINTSDEA